MAFCFWFTYGSNDRRGGRHKAQRSFGYSLANQQKAEGDQGKEQAKTKSRKSKKHVDDSLPKKRKKTNTSKHAEKNIRTTRSTSDSDQIMSMDIAGDPASFFTDTSMQSKPSSSLATPQRPRRSTACAKLLARAGLWCRRHIIHVSRCPFTEFAQVPADQD